MFNTQIALKSNVADIYNKSLLYTKTETDDLFNPISTSANVNTLNISILDTTISSGLLARYTKTETNDLMANFGGLH